MRNRITTSGTTTERETLRMQTKRGVHWRATFGAVCSVLAVTGMEYKHIIDAMFHITVLFKTRLFSGRQHELRYFCSFGM